MTDDTQPKRLSNRQRLDVGKLLEEHLECDDNKCRYEQGWNDTRIAAEVGGSATAVANFRRDVFGVLQQHPARSSGNLQALAERLNAHDVEISGNQKRLEQVAEAMDAEIIKLHRRIAKLEDATTKPQSNWSEAAE